MNEFSRFVEWAGGAQAAAQKLGCSVELVYKMQTGERGVSKDTARKIAELAPRRFSLQKLLFAAA